jgi:hypothetical protein
MHLNHLGLPVRDERLSQQFYSAYFGFKQASAQEYEDGTVIIRNADLCRVRHKSAYAEARIMPMRSARVLVSGLVAVRGSA